MYILVHHRIHDPQRFWTGVQDSEIPEHLKLHHTLSASDGTMATCLWEAESVDALRSLLDPMHDGMATNEYREAENREGLAIPRRYQVQIS